MVVVTQFQKRHCTKQHRSMNIVILQSLVKCKLLFFLCTCENFARDTVIAPLILHLSIGRRWVVSCMPHLLYLLGTHWIGDWVGPTAGLDIMEREISCTWQPSIYGSSCPYPNYCTDRPTLLPKFEERRRWRCPCLRYEGKWEASELNGLHI